MRCYGVAREFLVIATKFWEVTREFWVVAMVLPRSSGLLKLCCQGVLGCCYGVAKEFCVVARLLLGSSVLLFLFRCCQGVWGCC